MCVTLRAVLIATVSSSADRSAFQFFCKTANGTRASYSTIEGSKATKKAKGAKSNKGKYRAVPRATPLFHATSLRQAATTSQMASKPSRTGTGPPKPVEESADGVPKPLAATLMAEFQNLKDKFKNEDDVQEKGAWRGDQRGAAFGGGGGMLWCNGGVASVVVVDGVDFFQLLACPLTFSPVLDCNNWHAQNPRTSTWRRPRCCKNAVCFTTRAW
jgi:hypothetical protein